MVDGSGQTMTGKPSRGTPEDCGDVAETLEFVPPAIPPIGFNASALAAKAFHYWIFHYNPTGPTPPPPTPEEMLQAQQVASMLTNGTAAVVVSGSVQTLP